MDLKSGQKATFWAVRPFEDGKIIYEVWMNPVFGFALFKSPL